jgi:hypothetical protein
MSFDLDSTSNRLALTGALAKGTAGSHNFAFSPGPGLAPHNVYTLATFGSSDFTAADLTFSGLPSGLTGQFTVTSNSILFEIFGPPEILVQPQSTSVLLGGIANFSVTVNQSPQLSYQWYKDNTAITGATGPSLIISDVEGFDIGTYYVVITNAAGTTVSDPVVLSIASVALVRHAPLLNSSVVEGSIQQMLGEDVTLAGSSAFTGDLLVPGTPTVVLNNNPNYGGTLDGSGSLSPSNYLVTLNGGTSLGHVIRRTDPVSLPTVNAPAAPTGTRTVTINNGNQTVGDWNTIRNLTVNSNLGQIPVPAGTYGDFTAKGGSGFTVGVPGAQIPSIYSFQSLTLNGGAQLQVVGPVLIVIANGPGLNGGVMGDAANPQWLTLHIFAGNLTLNNSASIFGYVTVPAGTLTINGNCKVNGGAAADRLTINSQGKLQLSTSGN